MVSSRLLHGTLKAIVWLYKRAVGLPWLGSIIRTCSRRLGLPAREETLRQLMDLLGARAAWSFILSVIIVKLRRTYRRRRYGERPAANGMASLMLCQAAKMLHAAEDVPRAV